MNSWNPPLQDVGRDGRQVRLGQAEATLSKATRLANV